MGRQGRPPRLAHARHQRWSGHRAFPRLSAAFAGVSIVFAFSFPLSCAAPRDCFHGGTAMSDTIPQPAGYSSEEWTTRCELAALYRLVAHFRMTDLIDTHITARVPGPGHHFLINRYGVLFHEMCASDLVKIDSAGRVVEADADAHPERYRVNAAGFTIHSAVHMARPDLACVIHTHTSAGSAVSAQRQ